jgi:RNA polymerase sigma-70 factor (ECF subfamily)
MKGAYELVDCNVINKAKAGDRTAFILIYNIYRQKVYSTAFFILKDHQHAEDVVQETFLQVHLKIHKLKVLEAFEAWLYKITTNCCLKLLRKAKNIEVVELDENSFQLQGSELEVPDNIIIQMEMEAVVMKGIYSLDIKHRVVLTLFYFNNMSISEIADIIDCSEGTVKSRLFYGKKILKALLDKEYITDYKNNIGGAVYES